MPAVPGRDSVERSGSRDFSAQISHTQPSGSMVRVLIAPPIISMASRGADVSFRLGFRLSLQKMADHRFINGVADEGLAAAVISSDCRRRVVEEFFGHRNN
jgi:hypothetical protein